jgi:hypothetical protein
LADAPDVSARLLYHAAGFEVRYANSDCSVGEGDATSAVIYVMKDGAIVSMVQVYENIATCRPDWQAMNATELLGILENARVCQLDSLAGISACSEPLQPPTAQRQSIVEALSTPTA